jgi:hypothetical protein
MVAWGVPQAARVRAASASSTGLVVMRRYNGATGRSLHIDARSGKTFAHTFFLWTDAIKASCLLDGGNPFRLRHQGQQLRAG